MKIIENNAPKAVISIMSGLDCIKMDKMIAATKTNDIPNKICVQIMMGLLLLNTYIVSFVEFEVFRI